MKEKIIIRNTNLFYSFVVEELKGGYEQDSMGWHIWP